MIVLVVVTVRRAAVRAPDVEGARGLAELVAHAA
jgi:hypothetical protein